MGVRYGGVCGSSLMWCAAHALLGQNDGGRRMRGGLAGSARSLVLWSRDFMRVVSLEPKCGRESGGARRFARRVSAVRWWEVVEIIINDCWR